MIHRQRGVTLIELIVVVVIISILAAVAIPSYRQYVVRSQRTDAKDALLRLATAQEKFYLHNNRYAQEGERAAAPPAGLGIAASERGWYTLTIEFPTNDAEATQGFTLRATPAAGGPQATDSACTLFEVNDRGVRSAKSGDADNTDTCWN